MKRLLTTLFIATAFISFGQNHNFEWAISEGGVSSDFSYCVTSDIYGNVYTIGIFNDTVDFDPGIGVFELASNGLTDIYIQKLDPQGNLIWVKQMGGAYADYGYSIVTDDLGNVYTTGNFHGAVDFDPGPGSNVFIANGAITEEDIFIQKLDVNGNLVWVKQIGGLLLDSGNSIDIDELGNVYITGVFSDQVDFDPGIISNIVNSNGNTDIFILKLDNNGNFVWVKTMGGPMVDQGRCIDVDPQGNSHVTGMFEMTVDFDSGQGSNTLTSNGLEDVFVLKLDVDGNLNWVNSISGPQSDVCFAICHDNFGNVITTGHFKDSTDLDPSLMEQYSLSSGNYDVFVQKLNTDGQLVWAKTMGGANIDQGVSIDVDQNGNIYTTGIFNSPSINFYSNSIDSVMISMGGYDAYIQKMDSNGNFQWAKQIGGADNQNSRYIHLDMYGNIYTTGWFRGLVDFDPNIDSSMFNSVGLTDIFIQKLIGCNSTISIFNDLNQNCVLENELGVEGVNVSITPGNYIATTGSSGIALFPSLSDGTYTVTIDTTNLNWSPTCGASQTFTVTNGLTDCISFGLVINNLCTDPDISIFAPSLRRCFSNRIVYVSACNSLTATGVLDSSYVDVELDPLLTLNSASLLYTDLGNNTFRFETGDIIPGQCVNFTLSTTVSCNAQNGQTLCMDATLYPAEACNFDNTPSEPITNDGIGGTLDGLPQPCTLPWDQSSLSVEGWCTGDSVYFSVTNTGELGGGDMECYSPVWLTVDGVVTDTDSLMIQGGETVIYAYPASGQTFFLNAEQHPLHPGNSHPNAHVELCGDSTNWTPGIVNQFPQDDADPDVDIYCGQVTAPVDPNDKTGYPLGQTEAHYVQPNQQLQYVARFQNTGTDTAVNVVVRDTLDLDLNIFTVTPGVASHPYSFKMYGPRVLEWTFENINLPDSTTNIEESNGFLTFHVDQVPNLAPGTVINNSVDIYFDFEFPITTNTTEHVIYEGFVDVCDYTTAEIIYSCGDYVWAVNGQTYNQSGQYTEFLTSQLGCDSTATLDLTIENFEASATLIGPNVIQASPGVSYQWINCATGEYLSSATNQIVTVIDGVYAVIVNNGTCIDQSECVTVNTVGLSSNKLGLKLYPNPSKGNIKIESFGQIPLSFEIIALDGRVLQKGSIKQGINDFDLQNLINGSYVFQTDEVKIPFVINR